jgi:hypothetical protein
MKMQPATIVRVYTLIVLALSCYLLVGGGKAAFFPKLSMVTSDQAPAEIDGYPVPRFEVSQSSRLFGVLRIVSGLAIGLYILKPFLPVGLKKPKGG